MIRIAFVVHGMQTGGIERSVTRIIAGIDRQCFEPIVICLTTTGPAAEWLPAGVPVFEIKKRSGNDFGSIRRLASVLRKQKIDLVQSHNWGTLAETAVSRKLARVPAHIHAERGTVLGSTERSGWKMSARAAVMKLVLGSVNQVMSNSHAVAEKVEKSCGYSAQRITIIPNGVPAYSVEGRMQARQQIRSLLEIGAETTLIGSVGRLHAVKGFDILVQAMVELDCQRPVNLVIVGEGEQRKQIETMVREKGLSECVHLVGHKEDVAPWLLALDCFVNSSHSEGMSQSMVEAMSIGLPIVATDVGDASKMIRRQGMVCGETCAAGDFLALADSITTVLNDQELINQYSASAIDCHREFYSEASFNRSMHKFYEQTFGSVASTSDRRGKQAQSPDKSSVLAQTGSRCSANELD